MVARDRSATCGSMRSERPAWRASLHERGGREIWRVAAAGARELRRAAASIRMATARAAVLNSHTEPSATFASLSGR